MLKDDLLIPDRELIETHISWVFLGQDEVWKVKKPVFFGFLDFSTVEARRVACEAEVRLNTRLAPHVYKGVVPVTRDRRGRHQFGGAGDIVDYAVHMKRLPDRDRADLRLAAGRLSARDLESVAQRIATFHSQARCDTQTAAFGTIEVIRQNVCENFDQTRESIHTYVAADQAKGIERWQLAFLSEKAPLFDQRVASQRVRDGHGDLRLEHVYITDDGSVTIIDCIEFNDRFRFADVCADVAFLSMDLSWHGRVDLAEHFLSAYARAANDFDLFPLVDFYESYRAYVRGKVSSILASQLVDVPLRERANEEARRYYLLALASERRSLLSPIVLAIGGVIASGKSTVAEQIGEALSAPVVDADRTRKSLLGVTPTTSLPEAAWRGAYSPAFSEKVYREMLRRAEAVLESGRTVVIDASFRARSHRVAARDLARRSGVPFHFVECRAPQDLCRKRLRERAQQTGVSDGRLEIFDEFVARWDEVNELNASEHIRLDTSQPAAANIDTLKRQIPTWPEGLTQ